MLLLLDLDGFKAVNDRHGHQPGDQVLVAVVERLRSVLRAIDDVFRVGGDEFAVLLPGVALESDDAEQLCRRVIEAVSAPLSGGQHAGRCQLRHRRCAPRRNAGRPARAG